MNSIRFDGLVDMIAPLGVSHVQLRDGRNILVPANRIVAVPETEWVSLQGVGFVRVLEPQK